MYYIKGHNESINAILSAIKCDSGSSLSSSQLNSSYINFLKKESVIENYDYSKNIILTDFEGLRPMCPDFCYGKEGHFANNSQILTERLSNGYFQNALSKFSKSSPEIFSIANFIIKVIVLNQLNSHTKGTTADTLGLACLDFKDHFDEQDFIELVMHQMVHMLLFLDDHNNPHMVDNNYNVMIETGLKFILGGTKFPAYLAFHSYIVGIEMLHFRKNHSGLDYLGNYHGSTERIVRVCDKFKECMMKNIGLFTLRGKSFLEESFAILDDFKKPYKKVSN